MLPCMSRTVSDKLGMYVGEQRGWPCYAVRCVSKSPAGWSCACQKHEVATPGKAAGASRIEVSRQATMSSEYEYE